MKTKNIKIAIKSEEELYTEVNAVWEKAERGEKVKKHEGLYFENLEAMRKVLTENRLRILKIIKKNILHQYMNWQSFSRGTLKIPTTMFNSLQVLVSWI